MPYNQAPRSTHPFTYKWLGEDVCVLAGDIHKNYSHEKLILTMGECPNVLMIAGNHEAYGSSFSAVHTYLKGLEKEYPNFHYLNNDSITIKNTEFFGGTMFTNLEGEHTEFLCRQQLPDFSVITKLAKYSGDDMPNWDKRWTPKDHRTEHMIFCEALKEWKANYGPDTKKVVISHFLPSPKAVAPHFAGSELNPYFIQDMEHYMESIDLWLFGHTHTSFDFRIDKTRLVSNPYGYGQENSLGFNDSLIVGI